MNQQTRRSSGRAMSALIVGLIVLLDVALLWAACPDPSEYTAHLNWNMKDQGFVEKAVADAWRQVDVDWPGTNMTQTCLKAGGRSCAMRFAIEAAKKKFDKKALDISVANQLHPGGCPGSLRAAGETRVADYLRTK